MTPYSYRQIPGTYRVDVVIPPVRPPHNARSGRGTPGQIPGSKTHCNLGPRQVEIRPNARVAQPLWIGTCVNWQEEWAFGSRVLPL